MIYWTISLKDYIPEYNSILKILKKLILTAKKIKCGGGDLNPRTPMGLGPQPSAFGQTWQPPLLILNHTGCFA